VVWRQCELSDEHLHNQVGLKPHIGRDPGVHPGWPLSPNERRQSCRQCG
jgi:hypothetical protein